MPAAKLTPLAPIQNPWPSLMRMASSQKPQCSGSVVRSIIPAFRAEDSGSNPGRSINIYPNINGPPLIMASIVFF